MGYAGNAGGLPKPARKAAASRRGQLSLLPVPRYKDDILSQLLHADGTHAAVRQIEELLGGISQTLSRAADEIEQLRAKKKKK